MSGPAVAAYTFLPWVRRGLARAVTAPDEPSAHLTAQVKLRVTVQIDQAGEVSRTVRLYGPGDVTGLDTRQIVRTDPRPGTTSFEGGYFPQVQFARAELPWLFTPAAPGDGDSRLRPWLVLVCVRVQDGVRLDPAPGGPLPVLEIAPPASAAAELPDLSQSWAWAHAQVAGMADGQTPAEVLDSFPGRTCSRVLCPRRLEPGTAYLACLVPAFLVGVKAGLGEALDPADEQGLDPAWGSEAGALRLPVYHSWSFATGTDGSFETLVRQLVPRPLDPGSARPPLLDLSEPAGGMPSFDPAAAGAQLELASTLRVPGTGEPVWPDATRVPFQQALEPFLSAAPSGAITAPLYGQQQAGTDALPSDGAEPRWLRELNLDPRLRVAAGTGARVVQERQEQLMASAWEQAGAVREANALLQRSQVARELGGVLMERHFRPLGADGLLAITQPAHSRVVLSGQTVEGEVRASRVPAAAVSGAMRRLASPGGLLARRAGSEAIDILGAAGRLAVQPAPGVPAGMVTSAAAVAPPPAVDVRPALPAASIQARLIDRLAPETTVFERTQSLVLAPADTWARPDPLAPVAIAPVFAEPMYDGLQQLEPGLFLPGLADVAAESAALLATDARVIGAYMVGLNHEMSRELLWREFPADPAATTFLQFWDVRGQPGEPAARQDIPPIAEWRDGDLAAHVRAADAQLVLLVRGELLRRHPQTSVYAAPALPDGGLDPTSRLPAMFRAAIPPDIALIGFALSADAASGADPGGPGWYFAFEEHPAEPRFGFDEHARPGVPQTPDDLAWEHVPVSPSGHVDLARPLASAGADLQAAWARDAAGTARLTFQQPFRTAIHASRLLPHRGTTP